ncbi:MBL fold metallo-hydrolase [Candidatus Gracilibacteria bacterium]|nr:MBL fold metallo-hydrolase [Candidatus Gracilibacteria bacterium]MCF7898565.1 MBL fold metallo-hydrolase [Candidatus Paceibacterota bacterium]
MREMITEYRKRTTEFFHSYGKIILVIILVIFSVISITIIFSVIKPQKLKVSFFDVGQGDAIFVQTPSGKQLLIDGGATNIVLSRLADEMSYFDNDIDVIVATHPDADHVTGLIPVLEKYRIHTIVVSPSKGKTQMSDDLNKKIIDELADLHTAHTGDVIDFHDGVTATILYPGKNYKEKNNDTNDASVIVVINYGSESFLLTGDLPSTSEPELISSGLLSFTKNITVYKAGHHGSKTSSGEQLLSYIHPEYAVISAGKDNRYGHPSTEAIDRLQKYSKEIISTIDRGTISFVTDGRMMEVKTQK